MTIPESLQEALRAGKVVPFVGAGVSMSARRAGISDALFPSWPALLERGATWLGREGKDGPEAIVRGLLKADDPGEYLEAARRLRDGLGPLWYSFLKTELDPSREDADPASLGLAEKVWELGSKLVITTNYDRVLQWAGGNDVRMWDAHSVAEQAGGIRNGVDRRTVWHLHGHIGDAANMILTTDGYARLYPSNGVTQPEFEASLATLNHYIVSKSLLFLGFSLADQHLTGQLEKIVDLFRGAPGPHYVLVREAERSRIAALGLPLTLLTAADFGAPMEAYLGALAKLAAGTVKKAEDARDPSMRPYDPANPPFFVPYRPKGEHVIGREAALQKVRAQLVSGRRTNVGQTASFQGLGGLGKTQLAVEYAYRFKDEYPNGVIWITADRDLDSQLAELSVQARWIAPRSDSRLALEMAEHRLRSYSDCLIVFDNVETVDVLRHLLPEKNAQPHILLTSRNDVPEFMPVPLDPLSDEDSLRLLVQEAGREPQGDAELQAGADIASTLAGLPLALELAGSFLRRRPVSWVTYRDALRRNLKEALPPQFLESTTQHEADLYSTLKISEELFGQEPLLREVLDLLTWSGPAPMGSSLLNALLGSPDEVGVMSALGLGVSLRLLQPSNDGNGYAIHRLVREVRRVDAPLADRHKWVAEIAVRLGNWFEERRKDFAHLSAFEAEIDHLTAWLANAMDVAPEQTPRLMWLQAYPAYHHGRYRDSIRLLEMAQASYGALTPNDRALNANLLHDLGVTNSQAGNHQAATDLIEQALTIRRETLGERHPATVASLYNLGTTYYNLGDHQRALELAEEALTTRRETLGERHRDTAASLDRVGATYSNLGEHRRALELKEQALTIRREILGERHPATAASLDSVGTTYSSLGEHRRALELKGQALTIRRETLGERHPDTAASLNSVGAAYSNLGEHRRALQLAEQALTIRHEALGEQHPDTAASLDSVGTLYSNLRDHPRALSFFEEALAIRRETLGEQHPDTADSIAHVGLAMAMFGNVSAGIAMLREAFSIQRSMLGLRAFPSLHTAYHLAGWQAESGDGRGAIKLLDEALQAIERRNSMYEHLATLRSQLAGKIQRPGWRQPPKGGPGKKKPGKRK